VEIINSNKSAHRREAHTEELKISCCLQFTINFLYHLRWMPKLQEARGILNSLWPSALAY